MSRETLLFLFIAMGTSYLIYGTCDIENGVHSAS
jgi:hypothetical protein